MSPRITKHLVWLIIILLVSAGSDNARGDAHEIINTGKWTIDGLNALIVQAAKVNGTSARIDFISRQFLGVPYQEKTLVGGPYTPELLVINLAGVDCFTFLDYVEAMRRSKSYDDFKRNLKIIRYQSGRVDYQHRNHYVTDWIEFNADLIADVTEQIGADKTKKAAKILNGGTDNKKLLPGVPGRKRVINYIPAEALREEIAKRLKTGDYVGIYTNRPDLDVSHVGIVIRDGNKLLFRHASSKGPHRKVIDEDFMKYMVNKPGLVILKARPIKNNFYF
jgi:hypothetical protein